MRDSECYSQEVKEWMEQNKGIVAGKGKQRHYKLFDCIDIYCKGCSEDGVCDLCGVRLCHYLAKYVDDEHLLVFSRLSC